MMAIQILQLVQAALRNSVPAQLKGPATTVWLGAKTTEIEGSEGLVWGTQFQNQRLPVESPANATFVYLVQRSLE